MVGYYIMGYIYNNMGEPHKYNIGQIKPNTKENVLEDCIKFKNKQKYIHGVRN